MRLDFVFLAISMFIVWLILTPSPTAAVESTQFFDTEGHIYDDWGIFRTHGGGERGFLGLTADSLDPGIVYESLGDNADIAWQLGERFASKYADENRRAEEIFYFVRDRVRYTSDADSFGIPEFAQNADELASDIHDGSMGQGDCEDSAILLAVMYKSAGYRTAMVLVPGHVATVVYIPGYKRAARRLTIGGEYGWVWAEATGLNNPFGWLPENVTRGDFMIAAEIRESNLSTEDTQPMGVTVVTENNGGDSGYLSGASTIALIGSVGILWFSGGTYGRRKRRR